MRFDLASKLNRRCRINLHVAQELLNELGSSLENLQTQQSALLQFLKDKGIVTDEQLSPYLDQASNARNVEWRAARLRLQRVFDTSEQERQAQEKRVDQPSETGSSRQQNNDESSEAETVSTKPSSENSQAEEKPHKTETQSAASRSESLDSAQEKPRDRDKDAA